MQKDETELLKACIQAYADAKTTEAREIAFREITRRYPYPSLPLPAEASNLIEQAKNKLSVDTSKNAYQAALLDYEKALCIAPWWAPTHYERALLYAHIGKLPEAIRVMNRYLQLAPNEGMRPTRPPIQRQPILLSA